MARPSWKEYFMAIAELTATRSTCDRAHVGCVLVKDNRQVAAGYNGSIEDRPHCDDAGHLMVNNHCVRSVHAECNALFNAARLGVSVLGSTCYITHFPCWNCFKSLLNSGIKTIIYKDMYFSGMSKSIYDEIFACRGKVNIDHIDGMSFYHLHPKFENDVLVELK